MNGVPARTPHMQRLYAASRKIAGIDLRSTLRSGEHTIIDADGTTILGWADRRTRRCFPPVWVARNGSGFRVECPTLADAALALRDAKGA
jgi:hypothetical protein